MRLSVGKMALVTAPLAPATLAAQEGTNGFEVSRSKDSIDDTIAPSR